MVHDVTEFEFAAEVLPDLIFSSDNVRLARGFLGDSSPSWEAKVDIYTKNELLL